MQLWWSGAATARGDAGLSVQETAARAQAFAAAGTMTFDLVAKADQAASVAAMKLPGSQKDALTQDLARPDVHLVYVTVWDDVAEDGDIVTLRSHGMTLQVALTNVPQQFVIPVSGTGLDMDGVRDGGGGITVAIQAANDPVLAPLLDEGQSVHIPVALP